MVLAVSPSLSPRTFAACKNPARMAEAIFALVFTEKVLAVACFFRHW